MRTHDLFLLGPVVAAFGFTNCTSSRGDKEGVDTADYIFVDTCDNWADALCTTAVTNCGNSPAWHDACQRTFKASCLEAVADSEDPHGALDIFKNGCRATFAWRLNELSCDSFDGDDYGGWTADSLCPCAATVETVYDEALMEYVCP